MPKYYLTFSGEITNTYNINEVKRNFKQRFKITELQSKIIFSGKPITLKRNLTQQQVLRLATVIDEMGGVSYIEPMDKVTLPAGVQSDRRLNQRRVKIYGRRKYIRGGLLSNRRKNGERRVVH
ncbi:MAG: hypothetical protein KZQ64_04870 [gamma proteobacterium symbiont of Bathyaustriella thionipta]|nr:hypothetical protein [gamma proteobacterium symbiont of Bathyaustriella thionipta]MCU7948486.1 hypothetical protein [gamma proteobacterium symbiont of Bathyaustriella thionipta]MCU7952710.1 hypothetical protein [gamma proteobacterium symbiont of Bathyaustriella thionipta]MCU7955486.1 hypothetical protein [gamma proteobacterium symbiont of Bathyaustriella thionipta]MCU7966353.1 hypothetical protein [gamma proteobacterium symbiont of Bathyaustriella thionipta]